MAKLSSVNLSPATGPVAMYSVKTVLISAGWDVVSSGDGLSLYSSSGDILTTGASGAAGLGNARAYFNIRDPNSRVTLSFQMITNTTWRVKYSESAGFTGGSPTFQTVASATDEQVLYGAGTDASPTGTQMLHTDASYKFHIVANSTAQTGNNTYPFWFGCTVKQTGVCASLFLLEGMQNGTYNLLDQAPRVITTWYVSGGPTQANMATASTDTSLYTRGWVLYGLAGATFRRMSIATYTLNTANAINGTPVTTGTNGFDYSPYSPFGVQPLPALVCRSLGNGAQAGPKGFCSDVKVNTAASIVYTYTLNIDTVAYIAYGGLVLPWPENTSPGL